MVLVGRLRATCPRLKPLPCGVRWFLVALPRLFGSVVVDVFVVLVAVGFGSVEVA